ncbi:DUF3016 domain-containing protein [Thauera sp. Sel9]|uniref:DUF3016 domain-containing protein n=1 Tax=Thauera sp. Sel9 TaxID=2974299 RepID=UPI0021E112FB|nr:DUF3016 domain-containing protein [Thauera sp. Sel9]MCV2217659.1 DUF3016 domain-containing protein [Thauera sp. Sel9]
MLRKHLLAAAAVLLAFPITAPAEPPPQVTVEFVKPEGYIDVGRYGYDRERNLKTLERHFATEGKRCLKPGERIEVRVLDVDLAGRQEWWHHGNDNLRVMTDITWPRLEFEFTRHAADGTALESGRERLRDMNYLRRSAWVRHDGKPLPYEQAMLRDWFDKRFCRPQSDNLASHRP